MCTGLREIPHIFRYIIVIPGCGHDVRRLVCKMLYSGEMSDTFRVAVHHLSSFGQDCDKFHIFLGHVIMFIPVCGHDIRRLVSKILYPGGINGTVRVAVHHLA